MSKWETFCDVGYYHMWRLRLKTERGWNDGFHINTKAEAQALCQLLNKLERELTEALSDLKFRRDLFKLQEQQLNDVRAERDEARETAERYRLEANAMMMQRDRLAEALRELCETLLKDKPRDITDLLNKAGEALTAVEGGKP